MAEKDADFPDRFQGAGPMYAAVPLGTPWLDAATRGATTYVLQSPYGLLPELSDEEAHAAYFAYAGNSAFLDRGQVEAIADARGDGTFQRNEGLTGYNDWSEKADREFRETDAALAAGLDALPEPS